MLPAHAGMIPSRFPSPRPKAGAPRACGDDPVQVPNWVRQRLRERYVRTGEGQSAFARRAIIRLLEDEDEQRPKDGQC